MIEKATTYEDMLKLPKRDLIAQVREWMESEYTREYLKLKDPLRCPLHIWVAHNKAKCKRELVPNTAVCPLCGNPCCPDCQNHKVDPISRVTGYLQAVSGWNAAKKQEFKDRNRYDLTGEKPLTR